MSTAWVMSQLVSLSPKIQSVVGVSDASHFITKGTVWRKILDSALNDFAKLVEQNYPYHFEPKSPEFKAYLNISLKAWHQAFDHFDVLKSAMIEYSSTRQMSFPSYMKHQVYKTLLVRRKRKPKRMSDL